MRKQLRDLSSIRKVNCSWVHLMSHLIATTTTHLMSSVYKLFVNSCLCVCVCSQVLGRRAETERRCPRWNRGRPRAGSAAAHRCRGHRSGECRKELQELPLDDETAGDMFTLASGLAGEFSDTLHHHPFSSSSFLFPSIISLQANQEKRIGKLSYIHICFSLISTCSCILHFCIACVF